MGREGETEKTGFLIEALVEEKNTLKNANKGSRGKRGRGKGKSTGGGRGGGGGKRGSKTIRIEDEMVVL